MIRTEPNVHGPIHGPLPWPPAVYTHCPYHDGPTQPRRDGYDPDVYWCEECDRTIGIIRARAEGIE